MGSVMVVVDHPVSDRSVSKVVDEAFDASLSVYRSMLENLSPDELDSLEAILEKLLTRLEQVSAT